jgi:hypothetical protein
LATRHSGKPIVIRSGTSEHAAVAVPHKGDASVLEGSRPHLAGTVALTGMQREQDPDVSCARNLGSDIMPYILLWLLGIPIPIIILLALLWH